MPKRKHDSEEEISGHSEEEALTELLSRFAPRQKKAKKVPAKKRKRDSEDEQAAKKGKKAKKARQRPFIFIRAFMHRRCWCTDTFVAQAAGSDEESVEHSTVDGVRFKTLGEESWVDIGNKKRLTVRKFKSELFSPSERWQVIYLRITRQTIRGYQRGVPSLSSEILARALQTISCSQFYEDKETGEQKPGKKGVSLAVDEVNTSLQRIILVS